MSDLHFIPNAAPTAAEREAIDRAVGAGAGRRDLLLPALHAAQSRVGWISEGALNHICERLSVPPAEAYGVASFYAMFALKPRPARVVHVCDDIACKTKGADAICRQLTEKFGEPGTPTKNGQATWLRSPCLGICEQAPVAVVPCAEDVVHVDQHSARTKAPEQSLPRGPRFGVRDHDRIPGLRGETPQERRMPHVIDGSRRRRIAQGSGTTVQQVNQLLTARKQMEKMMKQMGKGKMPTLPPELTKSARR